MKKFRNAVVKFPEHLNRSSVDESMTKLVKKVVDQLHPQLDNCKKLQAVMIKCFLKLTVLLSVALYVQYQHSQASL